MMLIGLNHQKMVLFQILQNIVHLQGWDYKILFKRFNIQINLLKYANILMVCDFTLAPKLS